MLKSNLLWRGCHSGVWSTWQPGVLQGTNGEKPAILTAAPFRGLLQPKAHYRSGLTTDLI
ncbi:hypothetical protein CYO14_17120 [Salmonella enterica]|nr:hypothetical protein [Salmonella enterica]